MSTINDLNLNLQKQIVNWQIATWILLGLFISAVILTIYFALRKKYTSIRSTAPLCSGNGYLNVGDGVSNCVCDTGYTGFGCEACYPPAQRNETTNKCEVKN